jgi:DNA-binding CsgD family transcriptional regulator
VGEAAVIGRDEELGAVRAFLERLADGPGALVLSGEAGIGKTILWQAGVEDARERLDRVLTCHGVEAEASLSFAGLSDLLGGVLAEAGPSLAPPRRRALEIALLLAEPGGVAPDPHAIGLAVLDSLRVLAEQGSVLVALDDAQWLDPGSAAVLQIALRRLSDEPIGLLATVRKARELGEPFELERAFPDGRLERISLGPLSLAAVHRLLEDRLGLDLTRPELARVQEATAGNPFFALELGRELVRTDARPAPGRALPMPETLQELLGGRLARLPGETLDVLLEAAALARPTVDLVAAAHGDRERVISALEAGAHEGVVELDDSSVRFAHPLLASICYEQAPIWKRQAVHRRLADVVTDAEERGRHLALAAEGPDAAVASELDAAAEQAAARGAPAAAGELSERAADLTPTDPALARRRRVQAARFYALAGYRDQSTTLLDELLEHVPPSVERADVLTARISTLSGDTSELLAMCDEALVLAADDDARSARVLAFRLWVNLVKADVAASLADARVALERAERAGDPVLLAAVIARVAQAEGWAAEVTPGLLERGVEIERRLGLALEFAESPRISLARVLMRRGEADQARALLEELEAGAEERGDEQTRMFILWYLAMTEWLVGRWQEALDQAAAAHELSGQVQYLTGFTGRTKALIEADLGLVEQARASAQEGLAHARAYSSEAFVIVIHGVLGRLELALGNLRAAGNRLRDLPGRLLARGLNDPTQPVWADAIETLVALGELDQARVYLEHYEANAQRLRSPWALAGAARCRGLLSAAEGKPAAATAAFDASLADAAPFPLEHARTLLCLGTVRRQAQEKKAAREALEQALAMFEELGARLWAEKARAELRRISGRAPASDELTETERRVAELAAQGRMNKEIAAELFMGVSTVEAHLSHVYRKLGVRSRTELAGRAAIPVDEAAQL